MKELIVVFMMGFMCLCVDANTQTAHGSGNVLSSGNSNTIHHQSHISGSHNTHIAAVKGEEDYDSSQAIQDLESGDYRKVVFIDKEEDVKKKAPKHP